MEFQGEENGVWLMQSDRFSNTLMKESVAKRIRDTFQQFFAGIKFRLIPAPVAPALKLFNLISPCVTQALLKLLPP